MMVLMQAILAVDLGSLFAVAFLLISFVGWIMNFINAQNPPPPQPNRPVRKPQPRDKKVQSEIEDFLQQAIGRRGPKPKSGEAEGIEILEPRGGQPAVPKRRAPLAEAAPTPAQEVPAVMPVHPGEGNAARPGVGSLEPGTRLRSELEHRVGSRVGRRVQQDLPHDVNKSVSDHLGVFLEDKRGARRGGAFASGTRAVAGDPTILLSELRQPTSVRKAIILQEILSKPRALRKD